VLPVEPRGKEEKKKGGGGAALCAAGLEGKHDMPHSAVEWGRKKKGDLELILHGSKSKGERGKDFQRAHKAAA